MSFKGISVEQPVYDPTSDNIRLVWNISADVFASDKMLHVVFEQAFREMVQVIALKMLNDHRIELEDVCSFDNLRDALASELARQFVAWKMTGGPSKNLGDLVQLLTPQPSKLSMATQVQGTGSIVPFYNGRPIP